MPPPPPPPPAGGPPPPPPPTFKPPAPGGGGGDGRGLLLESIRQGKALKKTQVNDRSAPAVQNLKNSASGSETRGGSNGTRSGGVVAPPGLAGLFAGGMPKLKPVGSGTPRNPSPQKTAQSTPQRMTPPEPPPSSQKPTFPPEPPPSSQKPVFIQQSSANQPPGDEPLCGERKLSIGKPSVAPKPPALTMKGPRPNPPPKLPSLVIPQRMVDDTEDLPLPSPPPGVNRAQSMRLPKSASPTASHAPPVEYRTMGRAASKNMSPQPPPPPRNLNGPQRTRNSPLRPPSARPPPPPNKIPPAHPPPPPPPLNPPPPPPPHRGVGSPSVVVQPINGNGNLGPPPPPTRNSSIRNVPNNQSVASQPPSGVDLEARFRHLFVSLENLPRPEPFTGIAKTYPSKIAQSQKRQPAPQPPTTQLQLGTKLWVNNTSTC